MKARIVIIFCIGLMAVTAAFGQQRPTPIDLGLGTSFSFMNKDTSTLGEANVFNLDFVFRSRYIDFGIAVDYTNNWCDTAANDRLRFKAALGNTQFGFIGSGTGYYESVYNEMFLGYEYFFKASHYLKMNFDGSSTSWRKEATTHSIFFSDRLGITSEGIKDGVVKAFREQEISGLVMYSFSENMKTTFGDQLIESPIDPEDARSFFYEAGYKAEILGISLRSGKIGIGIDGGVAYTNMTPFGHHKGFKFTAGLSLNSYRFVGHCLEASYSRTALPNDVGINEITIKLNPIALFYALR